MSIKLKYAVIMIIMTLIVGISGCISPSDSKIDSNYSIDYGNTPIVNIGSDGHTEIGGLIKNNGNTDYKDVRINVLGLNGNGNVVVNKTVFIAILNMGEQTNYNVKFNTKQNVSTGKLELISATPV